MKGLRRRIEVLEGAGVAGLSLVARRWLGWPLTDGERQIAVAETTAISHTSIDTSGWSKELKTWLGVN
jgi:hypothetical protein